MFWGHVVYPPNEKSSFVFGTGLALWSLNASKLRFPVRPKMHSFEHMLLRPQKICKEFWGCFFCFLKWSQQAVFGFETYRLCFQSPTYSFWFLGVLQPRIYDYVPRAGNPRFFQCMLDEDMIRRVTRTV